MLSFQKVCTKFNTPFLFFNGKEQEHFLDDEVLCLAVNKENNLLALGFDNKNVTICYLDTFEEYFSSNGHKNYVWSILFSNNGDFLFSGDKSGIIIKWDVVKKCIVFKKKIHEEIVRDLKIYKEFLITAGGDRKIKIFDMEMMTLLEEFQIDDPCKFIINKNKIISVDYEEALFSIDLETKKIIQHPFTEVENGKSSPIWSICFSESRNSYILGNNEGYLIEYKDDQTIKSKKVTNDRFSDILLYDGYLISCNFDKHIRIHDIDTFEVLHSLEYQIRFNSMILVNRKYLIASGLSKNSMIVIHLNSCIKMLKVLNRKRDLNIYFHFI
jgi:WD40 repeat protein